MKIKHLPLLFSLCAFFQVSVFPAPGFALEETAESYGRACLAVEEFSLKTNEKITESAFSTQTSQPGPGKRLALYTEANVDALLFAVAFNDRDRKLANNWKPQLVEMNAWEERHLPAPPVTWDWKEGSEPFEIYVVFLKKTSEGSEELKTLVQALQNPAADPKLLNLQTQRLREMIQGWTANQDLTQFHAGAAPTAWGGTLRGAGFPWRQMAEKAVFGTNGRSFLIYRSGD